MTKIEKGICPRCVRELPMSAFYSATSTYCIECEKIYRKERYEEARDIKLNLISEYDSLVNRNLKLLDIFLNETRELADKRAKLSRLYKPEKVKNFIAEVEEL